MAASSCSEPPEGGFEALFRARSVALVGASATPGRLNAAPLRNLIRNGFRGAIYPVNPKHDEIAGVRAYRSVSELPGAPDVAITMVPARDTPAIVEECGRRGTKAVVVLTSGFEEIEGGARLAAEMAEAARRHGILLIGPNCEGVWSVRDRVILTFGSAAARDVLHHAPVAIISQSGAVAGAVSRHLQDSGFGCAYVASVGNESCVDVLDVLAWAIEQDDVKVALLFVEGLRRGERLLEIAERARTRGVSIVALKSGNSALGQEAVSSHTGKITGPYQVYRDIFRQAGIIQVEGLFELVEAAEILVSLPLPRQTGRPESGLSIFSIPGGTRALTADLCDRRGVPVARFERETVARLKAELPVFGNPENPTDLTGEVLSRPALFDSALELVAADPNTEALIIQFANRGPRDLRDRIDLMAGCASRNRIPVVATFLGDALPAEERHALAQRGIGAARDPGDAVRYLDWLYAARRNLTRRREVASGGTGRPALPQDGTWRAMAGLLDALGITRPAEALLRPGDGLDTFGDLRPPYVVKALPDAVEHKTELGAVEVGLASPEEALAAATRIRARIGDSDATLLVQEKVSGIEAILSVVLNPDFGPVLAIGTGGQAVELWSDVAYLGLPATEAEIRDAIGGLKLSVLLAGFRGAPPADDDALVAAALALSSAAAAWGDRLVELEINPLIVGRAGEGAVAVDVLLKLKGERA